jgi:hypothetical protein
MAEPIPTEPFQVNLPPAGPDHPLPVEWETFRREVGRLLAEGHFGRIVLIKGTSIIGIWRTLLEAIPTMRREFEIDGKQALIQRILPELPEDNYLWRTSGTCPHYLTRLPRTALKSAS